MQNGPDLERVEKLWKSQGLLVTSTLLVVASQSKWSGARLVALCQLLAERSKLKIMEPNNTCTLPQLLDKAEKRAPWFLCPARDAHMQACALDQCFLNCESEPS